MLEVEDDEEWLVSDTAEEEDDNTRYMFIDGGGWEDLVD